MLSRAIAWCTSKTCRLVTAGARSFRVRRQRLIGQRPSIQVTRERLTLGDSYGAHTICPVGMNRESVVYSFGVGEDASFDVALIRRFGLEVHAFDPTERSLTWVRARRLPKAFHMHAVALGTTDGVAKFFKPSDPRFVSHSTQVHSGVSSEAIDVQVRCLRTLMQARGHERIDVLKLDIEGAEYEVLWQVCEEAIDCQQILVEFHHHLPEFPYARTKEMIERLNQFGYKVFHVSRTGYEVSLIRD